MSSVGLAVALLIGTEIGLLALDRHPGGLDAMYGWLILALSLLTLLPLFIGWPDKRARWSSILLIAALLGCGRALLIHPPITDRDLAYYNAAPGSPRVFVTGRISGEPAYTDRSQRLRVSAQTIQVPPSPPKEVSGDMYVVLPRYPTFDVDEQLVLSGTLTAPPRSEGFDYPAYLARQGIFSYMSFPRVGSLGAGDTTGLQRLLVDARSRVREALRRNIAEPQAALAVGVVTGDRTSIPRDVQEAFLRSGTMHILAISGQNISLLVGVVWLFYGAASQRRRMSVPMFLLVLLMLAAYTTFTGGTSAVVRAALMGSVLLAAPLLHRRFDPIAALAVSAAVMVLFDPDVLADIGFQLSFAAMLGISLLGPPMYRQLKRWHIHAAASLPIATGLAAQLGSAPLVVLYSSIMSFVSLPATLTADIALLPLMVCGIITGFLGLVSDQLATISGYAAWLCASWLLWWVQFWGSLPGAALYLDPVNPSWVMLYYITFGGALWLFSNRKRREQLAHYVRTTRVWLLAILAVIFWVALVILLILRAR